MEKFKTNLPYALIILFGTLFYYGMRGGSDFLRYINYRKNTITYPSSFIMTLFWTWTVISNWQYLF